MCYTYLWTYFICSIKKETEDEKETLLQEKLLIRVINEFFLSNQHDQKMPIHYENMALKITLKNLNNAENWENKGCE